MLKADLKGGSRASTSTCTSPTPRRRCGCSSASTASARPPPSARWASGDGRGSQGRHGGRRHVRAAAARAARHVGRAVRRLRAQAPRAATSAVIFGLERARPRGRDIVLADTAGRLHTEGQP
jgi:hypothetical protein